MQIENRLTQKHQRSTHAGAFGHDRIHQFIIADLSWHIDDSHFHFAVLLIGSVSQFFPFDVGRFRSKIVLDSLIVSDEDRGHRSYGRGHNSRYIEHGHGQKPTGLDEDTSE